MLNFCPWHLCLEKSLKQNYCLRPKLILAIRTQTKRLQYNMTFHSCIKMKAGIHTRASSEYLNTRKNFCTRWYTSDAADAMHIHRHQLTWVTRQLQIPQDSKPTPVLPHGESVWVHASVSNLCCHLLCHFEYKHLVPCIPVNNAFSALTLFVGRQEGLRTVKNWVVGCWRGYLSGAQCSLAYGPGDATATHCLLLQ